MFYTPDMNNGNNVFVFGSNLAGRHGAGAAKIARQHWGALWGQYHGRTGGMSYAIPTKDAELRVLPLQRVREYVNDFIWYAKDHPELTFLVTAIGCGLAGYEPYEIAPFFAYAPANCILPAEFNSVLA